jgi:RimJ/RimL family protein N-acetyltransferase
MSSKPPRPEIPALADLDLVLRTPRLLLRPITEADVDALWPHVSNPELPRMVTWAAHTDRSETVELVRLKVEALAKATDVTWVIEHEGRANGMVSLDGITWALRACRLDRAELGYWIAAALRGQGLMSEAAGAAPRFAFETLGLHKVTVGCFDVNEASRRVIERLGFRFLARHLDDYWRDGRWWSVLRYELTAAEWAAR